jgi:hypothetical protein
VHLIYLDRERVLNKSVRVCCVRKERVRMKEEEEGLEKEDERESKREKEQFGERKGEEAKGGKERKEKRDSERKETIEFTDYHANEQRVPWHVLLGC